MRAGNEGKGDAIFNIPFFSYIQVNVFLLKLILLSVLPGLEINAIKSIIEKNIVSNSISFSHQFVYLFTAYFSFHSSFCSLFFPNPRCYLSVFFAFAYSHRFVVNVSIAKRLHYCCRTQVEA